MSNTLSKSKCEWKECKLGNLAEITSSKRIFYSDYVLEGTPFYRSKEIIERSLGETGGEPLYISREKYFDIKEKFGAPQNGDLLISAVGERAGIPFVVKNQGDFYFKDGNLIWLRNIKPHLDIVYFCYWIKSNSGQMALESIMIGSAQKALTIVGLKSLEIPLPSLPEQRAIAGVLSSLDDKIDLLHRQNKTLEGMAEALWRKMFVEDADPGWKKGKLGEMIESIETGRRPKGGIDPNLSLGVPSIGAENINGIGNYEYNKTKYITEEYYTKMNSGKIQNYDILIYKDGAYIGKKSMFANGFPFEKCCVNEHVFILRTGSVNNQLYLYFVLEQEELEQLNANSAQPGLNQEALKNFEIIIPSNELTDTFGTKVKPLIDKIFTNSIQVRTLSRLRDTLLPKLMSGQVRVKL